MNKFCSNMIHIDKNVKNYIKKETQIFHRNKKHKCNHFVINLVPICLDKNMKNYFKNICFFIKIKNMTIITFS